MNHVPSTLAAALLLAAAATAMGQAPAINGTKEAFYGAPLWVNTTNPTSFGDNVPGNFPCDDFGSGIQLAINNSNTGGINGAACTGAATGAAAVMNGIEFKVPFSAIANPTAATFKLGGFINGNGHDFLSNQVIGLTACAPNFGEPRGLDFNTVTGNQFVTITNGSTVVAVAPTIDGQLDATFYGSPLFTNVVETGFGDSTTSTSSSAGGSEIDAVYARIVTVAGEKALYVFISGNLETNFNKLDIFLDTVPGAGQNRIRGDNNTSVDFNAINRMGDNGPALGLIFDAGFDPDFFLTCTNGGTPTNTFANFAALPTGGNGAGRFVGQSVEPAPIVVMPCVPTLTSVPSADKAYGSEMDAIYGKVCDNFLYLFIAGNLSVDGTRIDMFFDVNSASPGGNQGQQQLRGDNVAVDNGGLERMGTKPFGMPSENTSGGPDGPGLRFDGGFNADYWLTFRNTGFNTADPTEQGSHSAIIRTAGANGNILDFQGLLDYGSFVFADKAAVNPLSYNGSTCVRRDMANACAPNGAGSFWNPAALPGIDVQGDLLGVINNLNPVSEIFASYAPRLISSAPRDPLGKNPGGVNVVFPDLVQLSINNINTAGVTATTATGADQVTTGLEVAIRIDELGWDGLSTIRLCAFISGADHGTISNQVSGGLPAATTASLGEARTVDFSLIPGEQSVIIPVVTTCAASSLGACCAGSTCSATTMAGCSGTFTRFVGPSTTCNAAGNTTSPCCKADYNQSGAVTVQDIFDFLSGYFTTNPRADFNGLGGVTVQDIFDYLAAYFTGCH